MEQKSLLSILCFLLISFGAASVSAQTCMDDNGNFSPNGTYDANRRLMLSSLPSNVTAQDGLFYNGSIGQEPNRVYATGMCILGTTPEVCSECIMTASDSLMQICPNQTNAFTWVGDATLCYVRYSNTSFSGSADLDPREWFTNARNITSNLTEFTRIWEGLMGRMIDAASTAKGTPSSSNNHYTADSAALTPGKNIYALLQCTPDLSSADCDNCLRRSAVDYQGCCGQNKGGRILRPSCYFRWELYTYSNAFGNITVASPPPQPPVTVPQPSGDQANTTENDTSKGISAGIIAAITVPTVVIVFILLVLGLVLFRRRKSFQRTEIQSVFCFHVKKKVKKTYDIAAADDEGGDITTVGSLQFDFKVVQDATDNFSIRNKLGHGGFGEVYKGTLPNGLQVAVKRLSKKSGQGEKEFKNEVIVVAKILSSFSDFVWKEKRRYLYTNSRMQSQLDWTKRYNIIRGIARGILYLHQDSRLTIIHRDLKAGNVLLDADMNPKVADFGMARIFEMDQTEDNTRRVVGTYGYMAPEYAMHGQFSMKSDVYSFGVLVLEIISGKRNSSLSQIDGSAGNLVTYTWRLWSNGSPLELVDPSFQDNYQTNEITRCIHIALLCVQEEADDRPTMSAILQMLTTSSMALAVPQPPGFFFRSRHEQVERAGPSMDSSALCSIDDASITSVAPR